MKKLIRVITDFAHTRENEYFRVFWSCSFSSRKGKFFWSWSKKLIRAMTDFAHTRENGYFLFIIDTQHPNWHTFISSNNIIIL